MYIFILLYTGAAKSRAAAAPPAPKPGGLAPPPPMPAGGRGSLIKDAPKQAAAAGPPATGMNALFSELNKVLRELSPIQGSRFLPEPLLVQRMLPTLT